MTLAVRATSAAVGVGKGRGREMVGKEGRVYWMITDKA